MLSAEEDLLKELKIKSVGHRLLMLKSIQQLRVVAGFEWTDDQQNEAHFSGSSGELTARLEDMIRERDIVIDEILKQLNQIKSEVEQLKQAESTPAPLSASSKPSLKNMKQSPSFNNLGNLKATGSQESFQSSAGNNTTAETAPEAGLIKVYGHDLRINDSADAYKTVVVNIDDTCSRVLPMAMKKWGIKDDWKKFALFKSVGGEETCLSYDDKPWALVMQSKDSPVFILKSLRTTESVILTVSDKKKTMSRFSHIMEASRQSRMSTFNDNKSISASNVSARDTSQMSKYLSSISTSSPTGATETAVAIYEYKAERDDELDVNIGDTFIIRDKTETGWWVVERDAVPGWVPSGCLVESSGENPSAPQNGFALYDYDAVGGNELSLKKDDHLVILKKYQHWFMASLDGKEGWVPSCYVGIDDQSIKKTETKLDAIEENMEESEEMKKNNSIPRRQEKHQSKASQRASAAYQEFVGGVSRLKKSSVYGNIPKFGTSSTLKTLVNASTHSNSVAGGNSHGALDKLDSLLDSFDPYLEENPSARQSMLTSAKPETRHNGDSERRLGNLINDLAQNVADLHEEVSASQAGSVDSIASAEVKAATKQLATIVSGSQQKVAKYDELTDKLADLLEECSRMAETKTVESESTRIESVNQTLVNTYTALNNVTDMLLKQAETSEDANARTLKRTSQTEYDIEDPSTKQNSQPLSTPLRGRPSKNHIFTSELVAIDNQRQLKSQQQPSSSDQSIPTSIKSSIAAPSSRKIIPYQQLVRKEVTADIDLEHLEMYLSNEECLQYLGCTCDELRDMPSWQLNQRKKRANLLI